jgi:C-terminal processing protease CtpA/Prc
VLFRSIVATLVFDSSFIFVSGQTPEPEGSKTDKPAVNKIEPQRDIQLPAGVNLQFLIKELAREIDLNVLFDSESRLQYRTAKIEIKNVTVPDALKYIFLQEGLVSEEVGPKTILVSVQARSTTIPQIGVGITQLNEQLAKYFGVDSGILISYVRPDTPGSKAGLKAGDVITHVNDVPVRGAVTAIRVIDDNKDRDITLRIVRNRKDQTVNLRINNELP